MSDMVNLVRVLTSATGNSTPITLGSAYSQLFMTPAEAGAVDGRTYTYLIVDANNWELGKGVYTSSGNTLARTTILASRSGGTLGSSRISLSGTAQVRFVQAAEDIGGIGGTRGVTGTSDTIASTDLGRAIIYSNAGAIAVSLAQAGTAGFLDGRATFVANAGNGAVTITPATSTINGAATLVLPKNMGAHIWSDGTNYQAFIVPIGRPVLAANNLSDLADVDTALGNLGGTTLGKSLFKAASAAAARTAEGAVGVIRVQVFTSSGTYTPDAHLLYAIIEGVGGGGAGGGVQGNSSQLRTAGGGGAAGYSRKTASKSDIGSSQTVTVGSAGAGSSGAGGGAGGDTSVGSLMVAKGGSGGLVATDQGGSSGGVGGIAGTGDFTCAGGSGNSSNGMTTGAGAFLSSGAGGNSYFGGGARSTLGNGPNAGIAASGYGSGGSGAAIATSASNTAGGNGSAGVVIITEFCSE